MSDVLEVLPVGEVEPFARVYGQPLEQMPLDLYIPPDALAIMLDAFEGPLDLLLYMIRRANIDILDIPMAPLTRQYLDYVEAMRASNLELAADYLVMAAVLIEIKSRMLLPRPKQGEGDEALDPRAELVRRLMEYEQMKLAGQNLNALPQAEREFFWVETLVEKSLLVRLPEVSVSDLKDAWRNFPFASTWASFCVLCRQRAASFSLKPCLTRKWACRVWSSISSPCLNWAAKN